MNVLSLCGPESGIPKNPSVRLLSYSKASEKVSVNLLLRMLLLLLLSLCYLLVLVHFCLLIFYHQYTAVLLSYLNKERPCCLCRAGGFLIQ